MSQERALEPGALTIGRSSDSDIVLSSARVSRHHARIDITDEGATLEDLGSSNGTLVNEEKITRTGLSHGDVVSIAGSIFSVERFGPEPALGVDSATIFLDATQIQDPDATAVAGAPAASRAQRPDGTVAVPVRPQTAVSTPTAEPRVSVSALPRGVVSDEMLRSPIISERALVENAVEVQTAEVVSVGGGLGSFVLMDLLRNAGMSTADLVAIGTETRPHARYERLCQNSQIPPHERLRSNSDSCPDNVWGFPGYAVREGFSSLGRGDLKNALSVFWSVFGEPALAQTYTPRTDQVFPSIDREAARIGWQQILQLGRVRAIRKTEEGRIVAIVSRTDISGGGDRRHVAIAGRAIHVAIGYPAIQLLPDLSAFREAYGGQDRVVNAYEEHDQVYAQLRQRGGVVLLRGRGIVASRIIQRLWEERRTNPNIKVVHLHRSRLAKGHTFGRTRRKVENEFEFQPFNWPKSCWTGEYRDILASASEEQRKGLLAAWGGTTTASRRDWRKIVQEGLSEGWYRPEYGSVQEVTPGANNRIVTRIQSSQAGGGVINLEADFVIDCTGLVASPVRSPLLADLMQTYQLPLSVAGRLPVANTFEIPQLRHHNSRLYAAGAMTLGGPQAAVDSFLGLQYAALAAFDDMLQLNLRGLRNLNGMYSFRQWTKWARGVAP